MRVEILHEREPDESCSVRVWLNGYEVTEEAMYVDIDPGRGHLRSEWDEMVEVETGELAAAVRTPRFLHAVRQAYEAAGVSKYIEDDDEIDSIG